MFSPIIFLEGHFAKWPSRKIMGENMAPTDPHLLEGYQHREAGLEGQLNIESVETDTLID